MIWLIGFYFVLFCILCFAIFECAKLLAISLALALYLCICYCFFIAAYTLDRFSFLIFNYVPLKKKKLLNWLDGYQDSIGDIVLVMVGSAVNIFL